MLLLSLVMWGAGSAQEVKLQGNNIIIESSAKGEKKAKGETKTPYTITVKGVKYPVYQGARGGLYYYNKEGKKVYLPKKAKELIKSSHKQK